MKEQSKALEMLTSFLKKNEFRLTFADVEWSKELIQDINKIKEAISELEALQSRSCENCKHLGLSQCLLEREVETNDGLGCIALLEICNPDMYYCYDYEPKDEE